MLLFNILMLFLLTTVDNIIPWMTIFHKTLSALQLFDPFFSSCCWAGCIVHPCRMGQHAEGMRFNYILCWDYPLFWNACFKVKIRNLWLWSQSFWWKKKNIFILIYLVLLSKIMDSNCSHEKFQLNFLEKW